MSQKRCCSGVLLLCNSCTGCCPAHPSQSGSALPLLLLPRVPSTDADFAPSCEAAIRINPVNSGLAEDDLAAVLSAKRLPNALVVPKVEGPDEVHWIMDRTMHLLNKHRHRQQLGSNGNSSSSSNNLDTGRQQPLALITMCESARALLDLR